MLVKVLVLVAVLAVSVSADCPAFGYSSSAANGPKNWGSLCPEYAACKTGAQQSPINLDSLAPDSYVLFDVIYRTQVDAEFTYAPNVLSLEATTKSTIEITTDTKADSYQLKEITFHHPSEHTIDGDSYELEIQLLHEAADGSLASVAYLVEAGGSGCAFLETLEADGIPTATNNPVIASRVLPQTPTTGPFITYTGSLTAPPCTENVDWYVQREPIKCSSAQINAIVKSIGTNNRPQVAVGSRTVETFVIHGAASTLTVGASLLSFAALFFLMF